MELIHRHNVKKQQNQDDNLALGKTEFSEFTKALMNKMQIEITHAFNLGNRIEGIGRTLVLFEFLPPAHFSA